LRSLVGALPDVSVAWYYTNDKAVHPYQSGHVGASVMGGPMIADLIQTWRMLAGKKVQAIDKIVDQLIKVDCDCYWIVSHNEGLRIALELIERQEKPVHVTVHDDWAGALCARSTRYRLMARRANKLSVKTLGAAHSFDVVSKGMQSYYKQLTDISAPVCHRYLPAETIAKYKHAEHELAELSVGHIGSVYSKKQLIAFVRLFNEYAIGNGKKPVVKMWGCLIAENDLPVGLQSIVKFYPTLPEEQVIPELAKCTFAYAQYPFDKHLAVFAKTSLPTKLTSYLQAGRPIFGHGPAVSSLTTFLNDTGLGAMWDSSDKEQGFVYLERVILVDIAPEKLENARRQYFGEANINLMNQVFLTLPYIDNGL